MLTPETDAQFVETCREEGINPAEAARSIADGTMVFLRSEASRHMENFKPLLVGTGTRPKISGLIGLGPRDTDRQAIIDTMSVILAARPDAVMDLTTNPEGVALRTDLKEVMGVPLGACLTYDLFTDPRRRLSRAEFLDRFEMGLATGVDYVLVHMGITPAISEAMKKSTRIVPTTSRGGGLIDRYMRIQHCDNPLIEHLDGIIEICRRREVVLDLGDIFRPACTADAANDELKWMELRLLAQLRAEILRGGVQVLCESGGHIPLHLIPELIPAYKEVLGGAPLWLAGPMVIDNAVTLDQVVNTLGILAAGQCGGDMFASITHNEHYAMPTAPDTAEAIRFARVAITALELARGKETETTRQRAMGQSRRRNSWAEQAELALYPDLADQAFIREGLKDGAPCTICGKYCPLVIVHKDDEKPVTASAVQPLPVIDRED